MVGIDDATVATVVGALAIVGALVKCTGNVVEACRKVFPSKRPEPATANGAPLPIKEKTR